MSALDTGRSMIDAADTVIIFLAAQFTHADLGLIQRDFNKFINEKPLLKHALAKRFEGVANVAWSKLATLTSDELPEATSYRADRHRAVLNDRVSRTVEQGGKREVSRIFFDTLLKQSVAEQNKYFRCGEGQVCEAMARLFA